MRCGVLRHACLRHAVSTYKHQRASLRRYSLQSSISGSSDGDRKTLKDLFKERRAFTLERAINTQLGLDHQLWDTGAFQCSVYPDLPKIMRLSDLLRPRHTLSGSERHHAPGSIQDRFIVRTVGVQLRGSQGIVQRLAARAGVSPEGAVLQNTAAADALLLVSGSHAVRPLLSWSGALQDSTRALQLARRQRERGLLPRNISLWAVSNPLTDSPDSVVRKVDAGAEVILTQPPLLRHRFEAWYEGLSRLGVLGAARVVIGACMLTSVRSAGFWLRLCGAAHTPGAEALTAAFARAERSGTAALEQHCYAHSKSQIEQVLQLPGVAGLHVMPVSKAGRRLAMQLASENVFKP